MPHGGMLHENTNQSEGKRALKLQKRVRFRVMNFPFAERSDKGFLLF